MERIVINTQESKAIGVLPLNVNGQDHDILFCYESLDEFKRTVKLAIKAQSMLENISGKNAAQDPVGMLEGFEEVSRIYRDIIKILLGSKGYADLTSLIGEQFQIVTAQPIITAVAGFYSEYYKNITSQYLNTQGKL